MDFNYCLTNTILSFTIYRGRRGRDRMVVGYTTSYVSDTFVSEQKNIIINVCSLFLKELNTRIKEYDAFKEKSFISKYMYSKYMYSQNN